jgi:hypothetical protein
MIVRFSLELALVSIIVENFASFVLHGFANVRLNRSLRRLQ